MRSEEIITLAKRAEALKRLARTGWAVAGLNTFREESIAEHSFGVSLLALLLARSLAQDGEKVDVQKAVLMAVIHDLPESEISDIPHTAILAGGKAMSEAKKTTEENVAASILSEDEGLLRSWREFDEQDVIESRIVRGADIIDMLQHALALEASGASAKMLDSFFQSSKPIIESLQIPLINEIFTTLVEEHQANLEKS